MNWDEIEVKWAAMARRVRSDLPKPVQAEPEDHLPSTLPREAHAPAAPDTEEVAAA